MENLTGSKDKKRCWGWITFHRLYWQRKNGKKYYEVEFKLDHDPNCWTLTIIRIWTAHIYRTLKQICNIPLTQSELLALNEKEF